MKLPRDLSSSDLIKALTQFEYTVDRQTGSHIRLVTQFKGEHHLTIPSHDPLKVGTLNAILRDLAEHLDLDREILLKMLFS